MSSTCCHMALVLAFMHWYSNLICNCFCPFFFYNFCLQIRKRCASFKEDIRDRVWLLCVSVCLSVASHISETCEAIAITFDTVSASVTGMHHMLIILISTFTQGHTDLSHENKKLLVISKIDQAIRELYLDNGNVYMWPSCVNFVLKRQTKTVNDSSIS